MIKQSKIFCKTDLYVLQNGYLHIWWWTSLLVQLCSKDFCVIKLTICILIVFCFKYLNIFDCVVWTLQRKKCKIIWSLFCIILEEVQIKFVTIKDWFQSYETSPLIKGLHHLYQSKNTLDMPVEKTLDPTDVRISAIFCDPMYIWSVLLHNIILLFIAERKLLIHIYNVLIFFLYICAMK